MIPPPNGSGSVPRPGGACPAPATPGARVQLAHGGGGRRTTELLDDIVFPHLPPPGGDPGTCHDGAVMPLAEGTYCFTTDSFVVHPLFFPGGDIGSLAVYGTVNDLAMCGGQPLCLSLSIIAEEGLAIDDLRRVVASVAGAAGRCGVGVATGDTKVVERGKGDGLYLNTTGVGVVPPGVRIDPASVREDDVVIVSGPIGRHGMAVMGQREGFAFATEIRSDAAPLHKPVRRLLDAAPGTRCLRDPTRGGLGQALVDLARASGLGFVIDEASVPIPEEVLAACEVLGLEPLHVASEGVLVAVVPPAEADAALGALRSTEAGRDARRIGEAARTPGGEVVTRTALGGEHVIDAFPGEQLPRIC